MAAPAPQQKLQIHIKRIRHSGLIKLNITNIHRNREGTVQSAGWNIACGAADLWFSECSHHTATNRLDALTHSLQAPAKLGQHRERLD